MGDNTNEIPVTIMQLALVGARITLWMAIFAVLLFGLFTYPLLTLVGFIPLFALAQYLRHERG